MFDGDDFKMHSINMCGDLFTVLERASIHCESKDATWLICSDAAISVINYTSQMSCWRSNKQAVNHSTTLWSAVKFKLGFDAHSVHAYMISTWKTDNGY